MFKSKGNTSRDNSFEESPRILHKNSDWVSPDELKLQHGKHICSGDQVAVLGLRSPFPASPRNKIDTNTYDLDGKRI